MQSRRLLTQIGDSEPKLKLFIISNKSPLYNQIKRLAIRLQKSVKILNSKNHTLVEYSLTQFDKDKDYREVTVEY